MAQAAPTFDWNVPDNADFLALLEQQIASTSQTNQLPPSSFQHLANYPQISPDASESSNLDRRDRSGSQESGMKMLQYRGGDDDDEDDYGSSGDEAQDHKRKKNGAAGTPSEGKKGKTGKGKGAVDDDDDGAKKSRRKSGGENKDDGKLNKRKEQNRAAQRAFRERKEKHVKDLEDKVAALLAATEGQKSENENLRDLLARLQQENVLLKQSAFTFSFQDKVGGAGSSVPVNATKPPSPPASIREKDADSPQSFVSASSSHNSYNNHSVSPATTASSGDSPSSIFNTVSNPDTPPTGQAFSSSGFNAFSAPNVNDLHIPETSSRSNSDLSQKSQPAQKQQPIQESTMGGFSPAFPGASSPPSFAFSPSAFFPADDQPTPSTSSFQLLASNPSYTSFREPMSLDAQMDFNFTNPLSPSSNELFGGQAQFDGSQFDDFFLHGTMPTFSPPALETNNPLSPTSAIMASLLRDSPSNESQDASPSSTASSEAPPISYSSEEVQYMLTNKISPAQFEKKRTGDLCCPTANTEEAFKKAVAQNPRGTFGPPVAPGSGLSSSPVDSKQGVLPSSAVIANATYPWDQANHDDFFANKIFLSADPKANNVPLDDMWKKIQSTPGYDPATFDLDCLCDEFKSRAKCTGNGAVLDEHDAQAVLEETAYKMRKP